jgi:dihydrofolate synthase/folylpolyglutamate synthase
MHRKMLVQGRIKMQYQEAVEYIEELRTRTAGKYLLGPVKMLAERMGHPEQKIPVIHIGGTNGKGSIGTYLANALAESGCVVGRFLSPGVLGYREQIQKISSVCMTGEKTWITEEETAECMTALAEQVRKMEQEGYPSPTAFEVETVMAFCCMVKWNVDVAVIEVGMGGKDDATNIIRQPLVTVFSGISKDHTAVLGDTLEEIAMQKAGIIKKNTVVVSVKQPPAVMKILRKTAEDKGVDFLVADREKVSAEKYSLQETSFFYQGKQYVLGQPGCYQVENAIAAVEVLKQLQKLGFSEIREGAVERAFYNTRWSGRFEIISQKPFILFDGAHNPAGAAALKQSLTTYFPGEKFQYVFGVFRDKDYPKILEEMLPLAQKIYTVKATGNRGMDGAELAAFLERQTIVRSQKISIINGGEIEEVLQEIRQKKPSQKTIIFGSLSFFSRISSS